MGNKGGIYNVVLQQGKEIIIVAAFSVFMAVLCRMFVVVGIVWSLADFVVRRLGKDGCL